MKQLLKNLYEISDEKDKNDRLLKVTIIKSGLKQEIELPYRVSGDYKQDTRVYVIKGPANNLVAIDKLLAAAAWCGSVGHSMTLKLDCDGDGNFRPIVAYPKFDMDALFDEAERQNLNNSEMSISYE